MGELHSEDENGEVATFQSLGVAAARLKNTWGLTKICQSKKRTLKNKGFWYFWKTKKIGFLLRKGKF